MKILQSKLFYKIKTLFFPNHCLICQKLCIDNYFCKDCLPGPKPFSLKLCQKCGAPIKYFTCRLYFYYFNKITSCFENEGAAQKALYGFKFGSMPVGAKFFGKYMAEKVISDFADVSFDMITAVPMHPENKHSRGYNQAELLGKEISKITHIPYVSLLKKSKKSSEQHKSDSIEKRFENVKNCYTVISKRPIEGKTVLLVDDIMTTGATLSECSRQLKLSRAEEVYCVTALKTVYKNADKPKNSSALS